MAGSKCDTATPASLLRSLTNAIGKRGKEKHIGKKRKNAHAASSCAPKNLFYRLTSEPLLEWEVTYEATVLNHKYIQIYRDVVAKSILSQKHKRCIHKAVFEYNPSNRKRHTTCELDCKITGIFKIGNFRWELTGTYGNKQE